MSILEVNAGPVRDLVAVVDDDEQIAEALKMVLTLRQTPVSVHGSAESLLSCLSFQQGKLMMQTSDAPDRPLRMAIVDLNLPGMNGIDLVVRLRQMQPQLPIVMITAALGGQLDERAHDLQGVTLLSKPFTLEALESALPVD